jgi:hypothetical protein
MFVVPCKRSSSRVYARATNAVRPRIKRWARVALAQRLKRVFNIGVETCRACGGAVKIISWIEDLTLIK